MSDDNLIEIHPQEMDHIVDIFWSKLNNHKFKNTRVTLDRERDPIFRLFKMATSILAKGYNTTKFEFSADANARDPEHVADVMLTLFYLIGDDIDIVETAVRNITNSPKRIWNIHIHGDIFKVLREDDWFVVKGTTLSMTPGCGLNMIYDDAWKVYDMICKTYDDSIGAAPAIIPPMKEGRSERWAPSVALEGMKFPNVTLTTDFGNDKKIFGISLCTKYGERSILSLSDLQKKLPLAKHISMINNSIKKKTELQFTMKHFYEKFVESGDLVYCFFCNDAQDTCDQDFLLKYAKNLKFMKIMGVCFNNILVNIGGNLIMNGNQDRNAVNWLPVMQNYSYALNRTPSSYSPIEYKRIPLSRQVSDAEKRARHPLSRRSTARVLNLPDWIQKYYITITGKPWRSRNSRSRSRSPRSRSPRSRSRSRSRSSRSSRSSTLSFPESQPLSGGTSKKNKSLYKKRKTKIHIRNKQKSSKLKKSHIKK